MTKFVVSDEYAMYGICDSQADAEEFILAMAEERAYDDYVSELYFGVSHMTTEGYINYICGLKRLQECWTIDEDGKWRNHPRMTARSAILEAALYDAICIDEVPCY